MPGSSAELHALLKRHYLGHYLGHYLAIDRSSLPSRCWSPSRHMTCTWAAAWARLRAMMSARH